jgi:hypothetical protein
MTDKAMTDKAMTDKMKFPGEMKLEVRLSEGSTSARVIKLVVRSPADGGKESKRGVWRRARDVVRVFIEAIDAGLFNGASEERAEILHTTAREHAGERVEAWELKTPPLDAEAFSVLARMLWAASARDVSIAENAREERLTLRALPPPRPASAPPWEVVKQIGDDAKDAIVTVCFEQDALPEVVTETHQALKAWAALVACGGFNGASGFPISSAVLSELGTELESEVFVSFEGIAVAADGWGALWNGLRRIHQHARIVRVEMH